MNHNQQDEKLYKAFGVLWRPYTNSGGNSWLADTPHCPDDNCHTLLDQKDPHQWHCVKCDKPYLCKETREIDKKNAQKMWEGHKTLDWAVYSLELPPTKISAGDEDDNYWVKAKLTEKSGKRIAVIYFGEKIKGKQKKTDYTQTFLDLEDEQLRFDKNNKNPMDVLCRLTAEFKDSIIQQKKK